MQELKKIIAQNIVELRKLNNMTQLQFAQQLNYTDKAVSKWERGESVPDIAVIKQIAELFNVSVDSLLTEHNENELENTIKTVVGEKEDKIEKKRVLNNHVIITCMSILLVWLIATFSFFMIDSIFDSASRHWLAFIVAVPISFIVWLVFNSIWFNTHNNYIIISLLMWSILATIHICFQILGGWNLFKLYFVGVPGQLIIILWSFIRTRKKKTNAE